MHAHSNESLRCVGCTYALAGFHRHRDRVTAVDRDELGAELVVGGVQRHCQVDLQRIRRKFADSRHDADGRDGDRAAADPQIGVQRPMADRTFG